MILAITPILLLSRDQSWVQFSEQRCKPVADMTWPKRTAERKRNMSSCHWPLCKVKSCSQLFPTLIELYGDLLLDGFRSAPLRISRYKQQMVGSKPSHRTATAVVANFDPYWCVWVNISTHLYMHMHIGPHSPPQKIGCHMLWHTRSRPRHLRVGLKGNPPFLNEDVFSLAWAPNSWVQIGVGQHCRPPPVCLIVFECKMASNGG